MVLLCALRIAAGQAELSQVPVGSHDFPCRSAGTAYSIVYVCETHEAGKAGVFSRFA
jgi:hypothetical protein